MTNVIVRTTEDIIATLRPKQGIQCEENILYLFDPNVVVSITEATSREWLEQQSVAYLNEYIKPVMDAYEEEKEREIDAYVEEKQSTIFFDNTNFTGTTTAETINVSGDFSADNITTNTLTVLSSATIPAPTTDNNPATKKYVDDAVASSTAGYHPDLFAHEWDDRIRNNVSWLRADTFSWQDGTAYEVAYQHLVDDIDGKTLQSETIQGITIQYYLADDTHRICPATEEQNLTDLYNLVGSANYYLLDTVNQRFKLPRKKNQHIIRSYRNGATYYNLYANGWIEQGGNYNRQTTGTMYLTLPVEMADINYTALTSCAVANRTTDFTSNWTFAPYSTTQVQIFSLGSVYGNYSWEVKGQSAVDLTGEREYLYYYVGNFTQTALENTAGLHTEEFNNKADTDLNNINPSANAKNTIEGWRDINYSAYIQIANNYTITKRGYVWGYNTANDANFALYVNGVYLGGGYTGHNGRFSAYAKVSAGDVITIGGNGPVVFFAPVKGE